MKNSSFFPTVDLSYSYSKCDDSKGYDHWYDVSLYPNASSSTAAVEQKYKIYVDEGDISVNLWSTDSITAKDLEAAGVEQEGLEGRYSFDLFDSTVKDGGQRTLEFDKASMKRIYDDIELVWNKTVDIVMVSFAGGGYRPMNQPPGEAGFFLPGRTGPTIWQYARPINHNWSPSDIMSSSFGFLKPGLHALHACLHICPMHACARMCTLAHVHVCMCTWCMCA